MNFQYYDPDVLVPFFKERVIPQNYIVCPGCVAMEVSLEDSIHYKDNMVEPDGQSDLFCSHCCDAIDESGRSFPIGEELVKKVKELEEIARLALL